jgi:hypothetical protein
MIMIWRKAMAEHILQMGNKDVKREQPIFQKALRAPKSDY